MTSEELKDQFNFIVQPVKAEPALPGSTGEGNRSDGSYGEIMAEQNTHKMHLMNTYICARSLDILLEGFSASHIHPINC